MYRIICNNLRNYAEDFNNDKSNPRYKPVYFLRLIEDLEEYHRHKKEGTDEYRYLSNFLWFLRGCERSEQILYELDILGIEAEIPTEDIDFSETYRIWQMFLKKAYWRD